MRGSVRAAYVSFTSTLEGVCSWMYLDIKGYVTTAIGNLIDPMRYAVSLPFCHADGPASIDEISTEWRYVKSRTDLMLMGGGAYRAITSLRLTPAGIDQIVGRKLAANDSYLRARYHSYEDWPADAQLATLSMAWACGAAFGERLFPRLDAALRARQFAIYSGIDKMTGLPALIGGAAFECKIHEAGNPGIVPRNRANRTLYANAQHAANLELDPDRLWWPREITDEPPTDACGMTVIDPPVPMSTPLPKRGNGDG